MIKYQFKFNLQNLLYINTSNIKDEFITLNLEIGNYNILYAIFFKISFQW